MMQCVPVHSNTVTCHLCCFELKTGTRLCIPSRFPRAELVRYPPSNLVDLCLHRLSHVNLCTILWAHTCKVTVPCICGSQLQQKHLEGLFTGCSTRTNSWSLALSEQMKRAVDELKKVSF